MPDITHISDLIPDAKNARRHNPRNVGMIVSALHEVGAARSGVIDEDGNILAGNGTAEALAQAGIERVKVVDAKGDEWVVVRRTGLTPDQKRKLALYDNRSAELADWDADELLKSVGEGLDLSALWTTEELKELTADANGNGAGGEDPGAQVDRAEELREKWGVERGQVWEIESKATPGKVHRVMCGDCRAVAAVSSLIGGDPVLLVTDPPYCSGGFQEAQRSGGTHGTITNDQLSSRGWTALMTKMLEACIPQTAYVFTDWRMWVGLYDLLESKGLAIRTMIVWDKETPNMGAIWRPQHELIAFASNTTSPRKAGVGGTGNVLRVKRTGNLLHDTEKPVSLIATLLSADGVAEGRDAFVIYDPFLGSGTTLIAAEQTGRICAGMEVEAGYVAVVLERASGLGLSPALASTPSVADPAPARVAT